MARHRSPGTLRYHGDARSFVRSRENRDWSGDDFTRPEGPVIAERFRGRDCRTVALKAPRHKIGPLRMWVDQESGFLLGEVNEHPDAADAQAWIEDAEFGLPLDGALFVWDGPSVTQDEVKAVQEEDLRALEESQRAWFRGARLGCPAADSSHGRSVADPVPPPRGRDLQRWKPCRCHLPAGE